MIRTARIDDAEAILRIYAPAVRESAASFELEPPTLDEMRARIANVSKQYPWLVFDRDGDVLAYAYAHSFRPRPAYQWSVEVSVYVDERARRMGVARQLYAALFPILARQGYCNAYAVIPLPNPASVVLHESLGFKPVGVLTNNGFKLGKWHDVGWWQFTIQPHPDSPAPPVPFQSL